MSAKALRCPVCNKPNDVPWSRCGQCKAALPNRTFGRSSRRPCQGDSEAPPIPGLAERIARMKELAELAGIAIAAGLTPPPLTKYPRDDSVE